jgi:hypothetical protein
MSKIGMPKFVLSFIIILAIIALVAVFLVVH